MIRLTALLLTMTPISSAGPNSFLYFAYGSNLSSERIHANSPSAVLRGAAKLNNYRLDFGYWSQRWHGSVATIVPEHPEHGQYIWGAVWEIDNADMPNLDKQEGIHSNIYEPVYVTVETMTEDNSKGESLTCRCYQLCKLPRKIAPGEAVPDNRKPSQTYLSIILKGAHESRLPLDYVECLQQIETNGYNDVSNIRKIMLTDSQ